MQEDDWVSIAVPSDGSYGISEGLMYSFPVRCKDGDYEIVQGLSMDDFSQSRMNLTQKELKEERDAVQRASRLIKHR
jgi:malate dehydrogenase